LGLCVWWGRRVLQGDGNFHRFTSQEDSLRKSGRHFDHPKRLCESLMLMLNVKVSRADILQFY
jgi:hypothetical protein